jgi:hypothetical protein
MGQLVEIDKSLYSNILQWCNENALNPVKYIEKALRERLATDKYGDLNQKIHKLDEPVETTVTKEEIHIISSEPLTEEVQIQEKYEVSKPNEFPESMDVLKKETTKKRQLKTK